MQNPPTIGPVNNEPSQDRLGIQYGCLLAAGYPGGPVLILPGSSAANLAAVMLREATANTQ